MASRFFFTTAAGRPVEIAGRRFKFEPTSILGGRVSGIYEASDPAEIAVLDAAATSRQGISEISAEEAEAQKKRRSRPPTFAASSPSAPKLVTPPPSFAVEGVGSADRAAGAAAKTPDVDLRPPQITSLMRTGRVKSPQPIVEERDRMAKK